MTESTSTNEPENLVAPEGQSGPTGVGKGAGGGTGVEAPPPIVAGEGGGAEAGFLNAKTDFYNVLKWAIGPFLAAIVVLFVFYLSNINVPLARLEERVDNLKNDVQKLDESFNVIKSELENMRGVLLEAGLLK